MDGFSWPRRVQHCHFIARGQLGRFNPHSRLRLGNSLEMKNAVCVYLPRPDENQRPRYAGGAGRSTPPRVFTRFFDRRSFSLSSYSSFLSSNLFSMMRSNNNNTFSEDVSKNSLSFSLFFQNRERVTFIRNK